MTPDAWINYLTAQQMVNHGERGFDLSRIGASYQDSQAGSYPSGPWADHRSAIAFTGDTQGTWNTLASQAQLSQDEGSIGEPYVSDDIGSFLGSNTTGNGNDPDDLYLRWLQLGTFQPIMREHSDEVDWGQNARLPWEYDAADPGRRRPVPAAARGTRALPLHARRPVPQHRAADDPGALPGLSRPGRRLHQPERVPARPGRAGRPGHPAGGKRRHPVWFPPGTWEDYFTGATFTGPTTATINVPTSRMPVFVKAGGIIPLQPASGNAQTAGTAPITLQVHAGANGSFSMYDDAGTGLGYQSGQSTQTPVSYTENASAATSTVTIGPASGSYPGEPGSRNYTVDLVDESQPTSVQVNGQTLASSAWSYNSATHTLQVPVGAVATGSTATVTQTGGTPVQLAEPATPVITFSSPATAAAGQQVTVTGSGFGAAQGSSYLTFSDNGTNWGAPSDLASFTVDSWSDSAITFTVPQPSGTNGQWAVTPGTAAGITVTTAAGTSGTTGVAISSAAPPTGAITGYQGLCLDDRGALTADYNPIQVYTCNGTSRAAVDGRVQRHPAGPRQVPRRQRRGHRQRHRRRPLRLQRDRRPDLGPAAQRRPRQPAVGQVPGGQRIRRLRHPGDHRRLQRPANQQWTLP